ncbi:helix-turn-helix domain-containing protein [Providencia manganoxydans]|uniref:helix-turn-helix domain-containing protein n=1 Tax=Morganellaceae TaxID=1903414 RepID=UPI0018C4CC53|nr:helix-turn-helix transcriptional regulator [Proteus terrae]MBG3090649.1 helix-turn-helix transcriptional regulator [Proteus terrae subsp. cibarius]
MNKYAGFKIKSLRLKNKISINEVAEKLDITPTYLSLIENGKKQPSIKVIKKASLFFNVPQESFLTESEFIKEMRESDTLNDFSELMLAFELFLQENEK